MLLLQRGKELGYKVTDEQFKRVLENIRKENKLEDDAQFAAALKQEGLTIDGLRKNLEKQMIINQVQQAEVAGKIGISEDEARAYYDTHKSEFTTDGHHHAARAADCRPRGPEGRERGGRRGREGEGRRGAQARAGGRAVPRAGHRVLRGAVEGERRPGRAAHRSTSSTPASASSSSPSSRAA